MSLKGGNHHLELGWKCSLKFGSFRPGPSVGRSVARQLRQGGLKLHAILSPPRRPSMNPSPPPCPFSASLPSPALPSSVPLSLNLSLPPISSSSLPPIFHGRRTSAAGPSAGRAARPTALLPPTPASKGEQKTLLMQQAGMRGRAPASQTQPALPPPDQLRAADQLRAQLTMTCSAGGADRHWERGRPQATP